MAESSRAAERRDGEALPEDVVVQVLARLPVRSLLRVRAVRKAWCRRVSDRGFVNTHHRHQPTQVIISCIGRPFEQFIGFSARAMDLGAADRGRVIAGFTHHLDDLAHYVDDPLLFRVHASCDGLLLLNADGAFYLCNPATRRGTLLPPLGANEIMALYRHDPSGEYRVLYRRDGEYHALSVGFHHRWTIDLPKPEQLGDPGMAYVNLRLAGGLPPSYYSPPALVRGVVHWSPQLELAAEGLGLYMVVFDTVAEVFSWMSPPPAFNLGPPPPPENGMRYTMQLFEMDGSLALSCCRHISTVELWLMQDYESKVWVCTRRVRLPFALVQPGVSAYMVSQKGDVLVNRLQPPQEGDVLVNLQHSVLHYDNAGHLLFEFRDVGRVEFTGHVFKESLVPPPSAHPPFFWGL
ncbi:hypothetical protein ACP70R_012514 [Stipagrostis hirtigluma subsp. patula]